MLRVATLDDVIGIVYVEATTTLDTYPNDEYGIGLEDVKSIDFHPKVAQWQHTLQSPSYKLWVQAEGEEIRGFIAVRKDGDSQEIYSQYILPEHQRQGLGTQLMEEALKWLDSDKSVKLRMASYLSKAADFYKKFGLRVNPLAEIGSWRLPTGKTIPTVEMNTRLEEPSVEERMPAPSPAPVVPEAPKVSLVTEEPPQKATETSPKQLVGRNELAKLSGVRASTIKHYTEVGILPFEQKETRLARRYNSTDAMKRLQEIQQLKDQGLAIKEIQQRLSQ